MGDLIRFVDSVASSPTVRLDLNDETTFWTKRFDAPPPRLRRSIAANAMRDGISVGSASYDGRTLTLELECRKSTQDLAATEIQKLWRELDRAINYLMYQPTGASKPVFFKTFRSDTSQLEDVMTQAAMRTFTIEVLAEPFALGLKETLGPYTVNNNPAAGSNPGYVDLPTIIGDVAAPLLYWDNPSGTAYRNRIVAVHAGSNATSTVTAVQAESMTLNVDTTNPGGGPDAAMSGTGTNNFRRTSFATVTTINAIRLTSASITQPGGSYRVLVAVRRSSATGTIRLKGEVKQTATAATTWEGDPVTTFETTVRQIVDLGVAYWPQSATVGAATVRGVCTANLYLFAARDSGTSTLDWDCVFLVPAGGQNDRAAGSQMLVDSEEYLTTITRVVLDGANDNGYITSSTSDPTTTGGDQLPIRAAGSFPVVMPGVANRLHVLSWWKGSAFSGPDATVGTTTTVSAAYWPRYLHVRPSST